MHALTALEIDRELASRGREIDAVTATLLELDRHPGLLLLRGFPPTRVTVLSANRIASVLLGRVPCDLATVTRAITDYQQVVAEVSGRRG